MLDDAGIERAIYWGYSMGGHIGYAIAHYAPERFDALILGGMHPYARDRGAAGLAGRGDPLRRHGGVHRGVGAARGTAPGADPGRVFANDPEALAAATAGSAGAPSFVDGIGAPAPSPC